MKHFDGIPPILNLGERQQAALVEAITGGHKNSHPDEPSGKYRNNPADNTPAFANGDVHYFSQKRRPSPTETSGTSLRNLSDYSSGLILASPRGYNNIVIENACVNPNVTGKQEMTVDEIKTNISNAKSSLHEQQKTLFTGNLIQMLHSSSESKRCQAILGMLNYAITGSKNDHIDFSQYVYEMNHDVILCTIRMSDHFASNDVIREKETKENIEPQSRVFLTIPDTTKTQQLKKNGVPVSENFDTSNPIDKTEIVINPAKLYIQDGQSSVQIRKKFTQILDILGKLFSHENIRKGLTGKIALRLNKNLPNLIDVYQQDKSGCSFKNGTPMQLQEEQRNIQPPATASTTVMPEQSKAGPQHESVMDPCQCQYAIFLENVCNKFNCPQEAREKLRAGFRAYCKAMQALL